MNDISIEELQNWVGRREVVEDVITLSTIANMNAMLGRGADELKSGDPLPPSWHWLFCNRGLAPKFLGPDGHVMKSDFTPPMPLPRRMWAGNKVTSDNPLTIGCPVKRINMIEDITEKNGRSGRLIFIRERSDFTDDRGGKLSDWKTIVFRGEADGDQEPKANPAPAEPTWRRIVEPDTVLLFRYSALTFNSHRIHYDREYTMSVEGYPALLVHGPLTATLLLDLLRENMPNGTVQEMNVRAVAPLFDNASFSLNGMPGEDGKSVRLWAATGEGDLAMTIDIVLA